MKNFTKIAAFLILLLMAAACDTVLGPPGSEPNSPMPYPTDAFPYDRVIEGQPNLNLLTVRGGLYAWKTGNNWHIRVAQAVQNPSPVLRQPVFTGNIHIDNALLVNVVRYNLSIRNDVGSRMNDISFRIEPENTVEGFDFQIKPISLSYCTRLEVSINGTILPDTVHLGNSMFVPTGLPISICIH